MNVIPDVPAQSQPITLVFVGDLMFGRRVEQARQVREQDDPFRAVGGALDSGDLTIGNLECVLGETRDFASWKPFDKIYLPAPKDSAARLKAAGFDLLALGNNHILDYGPKGFRSTIRILEKEGLGWVGSWEGQKKPNPPLIVEVRGKRVAFLSYSDVSPPYFGAKGKEQPGTIPPLPAVLKRDIPAARKQSDLLVVQVHWGKEYRSEPTDRQREIAHLLVDLGVDAVVGHHPHLLQPVERYKGSLIFYSLGNFLFDLRHPASYPSMVLRLRLDPGRPPAADFLPVWLGAMFPRPVKGREWDSFPAWLKETPTP